MDWWRLLAWNAAGGIVWATGIGLIAYYIGDAAAQAIGRYGLIAAGGAILLAGLGYLLVRRLERRVMGDETDSPRRPIARASAKLPPGARRFGEGGPVPRMRFLSAPDERDVAEREPGRALEPAELQALNWGKDLAPEGGEVGELAVALVPLARLAFRPVRTSSAAGVMEVNSRRSG
jgi:hypothetical protein